MLKLSDILLNPKKAERHPFEVIFVGFFYASISLLISAWLFPEQASFAMIFLTVIACLYIAQGIFVVEEKKEKNSKSEKWILEEHSKVIAFFMLLFLGFLFAFIFWSIVLPNNVSDKAFDLQKSTLQEIKSLTGMFSSQGAFSLILENNLKVLLLSLVLALFYGAGAIFILAWNASIMGFIIGEIVKNNLGLIALPHALLKYSIHGIPEIMAYFAGALAGGILFMTVIKNDLNKDVIKKTAIDVITIIILSVALLVIAGLIEVYISPLI